MQSRTACGESTPISASEGASWSGGSAGGTCEVVEGRRACVPSVGVCGRPFLIAGEPRLAGLRARGGWSCDDLGSVALQGSARAHVAAHWARAALMEHASIAAFARFTLQLMHVGAPLELIEASQQAMLDETAHARLCFGLAERYVGAPLGPGPLPMGEALLDIDLEAIVRMTFREGCVGETLAALEAHAAWDAATDPEVRRVLDRIGPDELRHAELAWKLVRWAFERDPALIRPLIAAEITRLGTEAALASSAPSAGGVPEHGVLGSAELAYVRSVAINDIILPCAESFLLQSIRRPANPVSAWPMS